MNRSVSSTKRHKVSTYRMILDRSIEITNETGVVDFRIDSLANSLKLSPGNITYHFAKKEEICSVIWSEYIKQIEQKTESLSSMLDLKQLFLILKDISMIMYRYRGVVCYMEGDVKSLEIEAESRDSYMAICREFFKRVTTLLERNGYLIKCSVRMYEVALLHRVTLMRWWLSGYMIDQALLKESKVVMVNQNALSILYSFYPDMSELGRRELFDINRLVVNDSLE